MQRTGWSSNTLYARVAEGLMVPPVKLSRRSVGWLAHEVDSLLHARMRELDDAGIKVLVADFIATRKVDAAAT